MKSTDIPVKFPIPWAKNAGGSYIRAIPQTTATPGAASLDQGFPALTFTPPGSGGKLPAGRDFNGIFNQITAWVRYLTTGGPRVYDGAFSTAIGGYPIGAVLPSSAIPGLFWRSTADDNTTDPDGGSPANWEPAYLGDSLKDSTVSNAKLAAIATARIKGRTTAGTGAVQDLTMAQVMAMLSTTTVNGNGTCRQWADGFKEQWGVASAIGPDGSATVTFPVAFTSAPDLGAVSLTIRKSTFSSGQDNIAELEGTPSNSTMTVRNNQAAGGGTADICWQAKGI